MGDARHFSGVGVVAPKRNWIERGACLLLVLLVHVLLLLAFAAESFLHPAPTAATIQWIDIALVSRPQTRKTFKPNLDLQLEAPPPPVIVLNDVEIGDEVVAAQSKSTSPAFPSLAELPGDERAAISGGGLGEGISGAGFESESGASTTCDEVQAKYPIASVRSNEQGKVVLMGEIAERGTIDHIVVNTSSGSRLLDAAAVAALKQWKCKPVILDGRPVRAKGRQVFNFSITTKKMNRK
jgi:protein TonB